MDGVATLDERGFHLIEQSASSIAARTDALFVAMLVLCGFMALLLCVLVVVFSVRYRAGSAAGRVNPPSHAGGLEVAWTIAPMLVFLALFVWAAYDHIEGRRVPEDALPVYVVAKQWMWTLQHGNGRREIGELHVPLGQAVVLVMASQDVIHSFSIPAFRLKQDVLPGRYTRLWFKATVLGEYRLLCTEYCGTAHSAMLGRVVVMRPQDYTRWLEQGPESAQGGEQGDSPRARGAALYRRLGCGDCHGAQAAAAAPALEGLYGRTVRLEDGRSFVADDDYLLRALLAPRTDIVAGYRPLMPSYQGLLDESALLDLVAYLRALGAPSSTSTGR